MGVYEDFKKFVLGGSLISMAVAFVVALAITALITALVADIIDPLIGAAGGLNFSSLGILTINHSSLLGGSFLSAIITFLILLAVVFFLIAYPYQKHQERVAKKAPTTTRQCPECLSAIPIAAKRCSFCTSVVPPVAPAAPAKS